VAASKGGDLPLPDLRRQPVEQGGKQRPVENPFPFVLGPQLIQPPEDLVMFGPRGHLQLAVEQKLELEMQLQLARRKSESEMAQHRRRGMHDPPKQELGLDLRMSGGLGMDGGALHRSRAGPFVPERAIPSAAHAERGILLKRLHLAGQSVPAADVVRMLQRNKFRPGAPQPKVDAPGRMEAGKNREPHAPVARGEGPDDSGRRVGRAAIQHHQLEVGEGLLQDALHRFRQRAGGVERGKQNRDAGRGAGQEKNGGRRA